MSENDLEYKKLLESLGDNYFYYVQDLDGVCTYVNPKIETILGYTQNEFLTHYSEYLIDDTHKETTVKKIELTIQGIEQESFHIHLRHKNGQTKILDVKAIPIKDEHDGVTSIQCVAHDITTHKIIEDALYQVAQKGWKEKGRPYFESLVQFLGTVFSLDYVIIDRLLPNNTVSTIGLYSNGEIQEEMLYNLSGTPCANVLTSKMCVYKSGVQELFPKDILLQHMEAQSYLGIPLWDSSGATIGLIAVLNKEPFVDTSLIETVLQIVAVRTAHELERLRDESELVKSESHLRTTLNSIADGVITTDTLGLITEMNPIASVITGWDCDEAIGKNLKDVFAITSISNDSLRLVDELISRVIERKETVNLGQDIELQTKNGSKIRVSHSGSPIINRENEVSGLVIVFRDVTHELKMQQQLQHDQKMDAIGQLAGGIAHDFNNMLTGISNAAELIIGNSGDIERVTNIVNMILKSTGRAAELSNKLLTFIRHPQLSSTAVNLQTSITDAVEILERTIDKRIVIDCNLDCSDCNIVADPAQLQSIFMNMGINAAHAQPDGGVLIISTINRVLDEKACQLLDPTLMPGNYVVVSVKDEGIGVSEKDLTRIFEPFYTTKPQGMGTGLGLSTVYAIIKQYHGYITVESEINKGTTFQMLFPVSDKKIIENEICHTTDRMASGTILIADDEEIIRLSLSMMLEDRGYTVDVAEDGVEAVKLVEMNPEKYDAIILDMMMPNLNGSDCLKKIHTIKPDVKAIISSGFNREKDLDQLKPFGLMGHLQKPYKNNELLNLLDTLINQ
ncbi:MAG: PAS domain S-box protein [Fibrobacterales bacterium]